MDKRKAFCEAFRNQYWGGDRGFLAWYRNLQYDLDFKGTIWLHLNGCKDWMGMYLSPDIGIEDLKLFAKNLSEPYEKQNDNDP